MKKFIFKSVLFLIVSTSLLSCSSDDSETTEPIVCPTGYTGTDCTAQITPTRIVISKIRVNLFPNTNAGNNGTLVLHPISLLDLEEAMEVHQL